METTKFWAIVKTTYSGFSFRSSWKEVVGLFSDKLEAEFFIYKEGNSCCEIQEMEISRPIDKTSREFKKFLEKKREDIQYQIKKSEECKENDTNTISKLTEELNKYNEIR